MRLFSRNTLSYSHSNSFSSYPSYGNSYNSIDNPNSLEEDDDDEDDCDYEIDFFKELSNGSLIFKILDDDCDMAGHIIVSARKEITLIKSNFYSFDKDDKKYLKGQVKKFCDALEH